MDKFIQFCVATLIYEWVSLGVIAVLFLFHFWWGHLLQTHPFLIAMVVTAVTMIFAPLVILAAILMSP